MKKNVKVLMEKMKKLQSQLREYERLYFIEVGKTTEQCLRGNGNIEELRDRVAQIKKEFGKEE